MNAPFPPPGEVGASVVESSPISSSYVAGLAAVHVDHRGMAHINLYSDQIDCNGEMERVLCDRLVMPREVMREIADRMQTAAMESQYLGKRAGAEMRQKMT